MSFLTPATSSLFLHHWQCQDALRSAGFRVTGNQASLNRALVPGTPMRV
jgi:hypothetical protein